MTTANRHPYARALFSRNPAHARTAIGSGRSAALSRTLRGLAARGVHVLAGQELVTDGLVIRCTVRDPHERAALRDLAARHRLGAFAVDADDLAKRLPELGSDMAWRAGMAVRALLEELDEGAADREWRQRTWGVPQ